MAKRVVLAYSGGLDTSVAVRWMIEHLGVEVVCVSADVGQEGTLEGNREKALGAGAIADEELDLREFAHDFLAPVIKANALYEGKYPLVSALTPTADRATSGRGGPSATAPTGSPTAAPGRATTRFASRCRRWRSPRTSS